MSGNQTTGAAGEFLVAAELARRGWVPSITPRGVERTDILAQHASNDRLIAVQVKTASPIYQFRLGARNETPSRTWANQCYVLVSLGSLLDSGASKKSNQLRLEIRSGVAELDEALDDLLERLAQVRIEDYDAVTRNSQFEIVRRQLKAADTAEGRLIAATLLAEEGLTLFGHPVSYQVRAQTRYVTAQEVQLVAYEALVKRLGRGPSAFTGTQSAMRMGDEPLTLTDQS